MVGSLDMATKGILTRKNMLCWSCMKGDQSIYIFMKVMCNPVYLPDVLPDLVKMDHKKSHGYKDTDK